MTTATRLGDDLSTMQEKLLHVSSEIAEGSELMAT